MNNFTQKLSLAWNNFKLLFFLRSFWRNKVVIISFGGGVLINLIIWYFWYFKIRLSGYPIYAPVSLLQISEKLHFYFLPILGLTSIILNTLLALYAFKKEALASYFLLGAAFFIQITILIFLFYFIKYSLI